MLAAFRIAGGHSGLWTGSAAVFGEAGLLAATALAGGLVVGAGNVRAVPVGIALGLLHAVAMLMAKFGFGRQPNEVLLFGSWIVLPLIGAIGARIGRWVLPPLEDFEQKRAAPATETRKAKPKAPPDPIAWLRVIGGTSLSIGCTVWAGPIRDFVIGTSGGSFMVDSRLQSKFVTWVISALAMMVGGVFAGTSTRSGFKHGFLVGLLTCIGIFFINSKLVGESLPAEKFFAAVFGLLETDALSPARLGLFLLTNALLICIFGGWIGAILLPRVGSGPAKLDRGAI